MVKLVFHFLPTEQVVKWKKVLRVVVSLNYTKNYINLASNISSALNAQRTRALGFDRPAANAFIYCDRSLQYALFSYPPSCPWESLQVKARPSQFPHGPPQHTVIGQSLDRAWANLRFSVQSLSNKEPHKESEHQKFDPDSNSQTDVMRS